MSEMIITTKDCRRVYETETERDAIKLFFADVLRGRIAKEELGLLGRVHGQTEGDDIMFRIAPALCKAGWFSVEEVKNLTKAADSDLDFTTEQIEQMVKADAWMLDLPDDWPEVVTTHVS